MPYNRSFPAETLARIEAEIRVQLPGSDPGLRYSVERVLARALAMASYEMDGFIEYVMKQILPTTCDAEYLPIHANLRAIERRTASFASGVVGFAGTAGAVIPQGTHLRRSDGAEYTTNADATIMAGAAVVAVTAVAEGVTGNLAAATSLALISPLAGVQSNATVSALGITGGVDIEDIESWRARVVERWRTPPHGGSQADYIAWAKEVPGVTRCWPFPHQLGLGSVYLLFVMDEKEGSIIPSPLEVAEVQSHIDNVRPVTADVTVAAPTAVPLNLSIQINPNSIAVQQAIAAELADLIRRESVPGGTLLLSHIREAISVAAGEADHILLSPSANVARAFGEITTLGTITFAGIV